MTCIECWRFKWQATACALLLSVVSAWAQAASPATADVSGDYKLSASDVILVTVFMEKDLSGEFRVSGNGEITFPLLVAVKVTGRTPAEVEKDIRERLINEDFMVDPQVTVAVKEYKARTVAVWGKVAKPGNVKLPAEQPMTIIEAIAEAGGLLPIAKESNIEVRRKGVEKPFIFDMKDLKKITDPKQMFYLQPNDTIEVKERFL
jgi:protein involved in polysaccharide export with SLBB domain